jgi:4-methylaminobutanoate oxidase (formaldehyde-forming)
VYDKIVEAGPQFSLRHAGLKALGSLRMEKGYRDYGHDLDNTDDSLETGLGFCLDFNKPNGFLGREAILAKKQAGTPKRRLAQVLVQDPNPLLFHAEVLWCNGQRAGYVRSASYGWSLGGAVGLAMIEGLTPENAAALDQRWIDQQSWQIEVANKRYPARVSLRPLLDPDNKKIKG